MTSPIPALLGLIAAIVLSGTGVSAESPAAIRVLYDNVAHDKQCEADWGFACLVTGREKTILFDSGARGDLLLANFEKMQLRPADVQLVVISHNHADHTGGLLPLLEANKNTAVYLPASTPETLRANVRPNAAGVTEVSQPIEICKGVSVLGPMGREIIEQSLVIETKNGLVIVTGCSHPGLIEIAEKAKAQFKRNIQMIVGGTHLLQHSDEALQGIIDDLKRLEVRKIGATHCSGDKAIARMRAAFGENFVEMGVGRAIEIGE
jgi:7,8-dihydropterin-6-yl-methyl-4-(beta-D-ribofuranosyl)aminobenzene 5'-phosphate synthase